MVQQLTRSRWEPGLPRGARYPRRYVRARPRGFPDNLLFLRQASHPPCQNHREIMRGLVSRHSHGPLSAKDYRESEKYLSPLLTRRSSPDGYSRGLGAIIGPGLRITIAVQLT